MPLPIVSAITALTMVTISLASAQESPSWGACAQVDTVVEFRTAECTSVRLPLRYPAGTDSISIGVMRIRAADTAIAQIWFLDGGPGDAGSASLGRLARVLDMPDIDIYTLDHRGVGQSALLRCPEQQAARSSEGHEISREEWAGCIAYISESRPDLDALTAANTAIDLNRLIDAMREPGKRVVLMGVSYGTYLAQRYLQQFPTQPDAVILDGIVPLDWSFAEFDSGLDLTARRVLGRCAEDIECRDRLGADPVQTTTSLLDSLATGHCGGIGLTPQLARLVLGSMLMVDAVPHAFLMGFIHRVQRCAWHDRIAVLHMFREVFSDLAEPPSHSPVLQRHVSMSELWPVDAPDSTTFEEALKRYIMTTEVSASFARTARVWPVYERPSDGENLVRYDGPMLLLHGGFDPTMPIERLRETRDLFGGSHQSFVLFPDAGHVVVNESACAVGVYQSFIRDPEDVLDTACMAMLPTLSLKPTVDQSKSIFGVDDMWGDTVSSLDSLLFVSVFRFSALVIGLAALVAAAFQLWKTRGVVLRSWIKTGAMFLFWVLVSGAVWIGIFIVPLLIRYDLAMVSALTLIVLHVLIGTWFVKRFAVRRLARS